MSLIRRQLPQPFLLCFVLLHACLHASAHIKWYQQVHGSTHMRQAQLNTTGRDPWAWSLLPSKVGKIWSHHLDRVSQSGHLQDALHWDHPIFHKFLNWLLCLTQFEALFLTLTDTLTFTRWKSSFGEFRVTVLPLVPKWNKYQQ